MWKIIKFLNKRLNEMLCVRMKTLIWLRLFPRVQDLPMADITELRNWGSAPNLYANNFDANCASTGLRAVIKTYPMETTGKDWDGWPRLREWVSGCIVYQNVSMQGSWHVAVEFDNTSVGNWEAVWFVDETKRYREVDIERCNVNKPKEILISVHDGETSGEGRRLYNHQYPLPNFHAEFTFKLRPFTRVYINGFLVFIGLQWRLPKKAQFIINSGVLADRGKSAREGIFKINGITHKRR